MNLQEIKDAGNATMRHEETPGMSPGWYRLSVGDTILAGDEFLTGDRWCLTNDEGMSVPGVRVYRRRIAETQPTPPAEGLGLCCRMLVYCACAQRTADLRPSEVRKLLHPFFSDEVITQAVDRVCGKASCKEPGDPV